MREKLPNRRRRTPIEFEIDGHTYKGGAGHYPDGRVGEVFLTAGKTGTSLQVMTSDAAVAASIALQFGAPLEVLQKAFLRNEDGKPSGPLGKMFDILVEGGGE